MARPLTHDTGLGELDNNAICQELSKPAGKKTETTKYIHWGRQINDCKIS